MSFLRPAGAALAAALATLAAGGCSRPAPTVAPLPPAQVSVSQPIVRETIDYDEYTGEVEAIYNVTVSARVSGYIKDVRFTDGQMVKKDDVLFDIDPSTYQAEYDVAKAQIASDEAKLRFSESQVTRNLALLKRGAVTQEDVDLSVSQRDENKAQVELSKANAEDKRLFLEWCKVTSPIDGRASRRTVDPGNQISGAAGMATALTTVVSLDPIYIYFDVDERAVQRYRQQAREGHNPVTDISKIDAARLPVYAALANDTEFKHEGYIDFVDNMVNQSSGTVRCRGRFDNPNGLMVPGYFARVRVRSGQPYMGTLVAERAILAQQSDRYVLVVNSDGVVVQRSIISGRLQNGLRAILGGVDPQDWVVVEGVQRARPGEKVEIHKVPMPQPAGMPGTGPGALPTGSTGPKPQTLPATPAGTGAAPAAPANTGAAPANTGAAPAAPAASPAPTNPETPAPAASAPSAPAPSPPAPAAESATATPPAAPTGASPTANPKP